MHSHRTRARSIATSRIRATRSSYAGYLLRGQSPDSIAPVYEPSSFASKTKREKAECGSQAFRIAECLFAIESSVEGGNRQGRQFRDRTLIRVANVPMRSSVDRAFVVAIRLMAIPTLTTLIWVGGFRDSELCSRNQEPWAASRITRRRFHSGISQQKRCALSATQLKFRATRVCVTSTRNLISQFLALQPSLRLSSALPLSQVLQPLPLCSLGIPFAGGCRAPKVTSAALRDRSLRISANVTDDFGNVTGLGPVLGCADLIVGMGSV